MNDQEEYNKWLRIANQNNINSNNFRMRVSYLNWDFKKAATEPISYEKSKLVVYAVYRDDDFIAAGTEEELSEQLNINKKTVRQNATPKRQKAAMDSPYSSLLFVRLDDED